MYCIFYQYFLLDLGNENADHTFMKNHHPFPPTPTSITDPVAELSKIIHLFTPFWIAFHITNSSENFYPLWDF